MDTVANMLRHAQIRKKLVKKKGLLGIGASQKVCSGRKRKAVSNKSAIWRTVTSEALDE